MIAAHGHVDMVQVHRRYSDLDRRLIAVRSANEHQRARGFIAISSGDFFDARQHFGEVVEKHSTDRPPVVGAGRRGGRCLGNLVASRSFGGGEPTSGTGGCSGGGSSPVVGRGRTQVATIVSFPNLEAASPAEIVGAFATALAIYRGLRPVEFEAEVAPAEEPPKAPPAPGE